MFDSSLALISARYTITALDVLSLLTSSYLYVLCQALDLRAMHHDCQSNLCALVRDLVRAHFPSASAEQTAALIPKLERAVLRALNATSSADCTARMRDVAAATTTPLVDFFAAEALDGELAHIAGFRAEFAQRADGVLRRLRVEYLEGSRGPAPASRYLGRTAKVYEFVRVELGIRMHGAENLHGFEMGPGVEDGTIGGSIALIHEAIRDGKMQGTVVELMKAVRSGEL